MRYKYYTSICLSGFGLLLTNLTLASPMLAVGSFFTDTTTYPLIARSEGHGKAWSYATNKDSLPFPCGGKEGEFIASSCSGSHCIAVGNYSNPGKFYYPLIAFSKDSGSTWSYVGDRDSLPLPNGTTSAYLSSSSCEGLNCVVVGGYNLAKDYNPLILHSNDGGATWARNDDYPSIELNDYAGRFSSVSCSGLVCVAVGDSDAVPLIANSQDGGATWTLRFHKNNPSTKLPDDFEGGSFNSVSCSGLACVAVGTYGQRAGGSFGRPLAATSDDGGSTWIFSIDSSTPALPVDSAVTILKDASCSGLKCVAAGFYLHNMGSSPLLAQSQDGGKSWVYAVKQDVPTFPANFKSGGFDSVSCSGNTCIAAGNYEDQTDGYPLVAASKDGGVTWEYTLNNSKPALPRGAMTSNLVKASCSGLDCIAAGKYSTGEAYFPLLARSNDGGQTWVYAINGKKPALPSKGRGGQFSGAYGDSSPGLSEYLQKLMTYKK